MLAVGGGLGFLCRRVRGRLLRCLRLLLLQPLQGPEFLALLRRQSLGLRSEFLECGHLCCGVFLPLL